MAMVRILSGKGHHCDYTPGSDVENGDVVVQGDLVGVADADIDASVKGALVTSGVVIAAQKATTSGSAITAGSQCYWDAGNEVATTTASTHKKLGTSVVAAADADGEVNIALGHHVA